MAKTALTPFEKLDPAEAWKPWQPDTKQPFDLKWAGHLYRRAAFGATLAEMRQAVKQGLPATLDRLLAGQPGADQRLERLVESGRIIAEHKTPVDLRGWWIYVMLHGLHPLREKLTLFWHDHFATSINKVTSASRMFEQNLALRRHALGKFEPFLQAMSTDPAMLLWLDAASNVKGKPNENYARELMELFSLGVGNYTETDIREGARAFTGWETDEGKASFDPARHDIGEKTVLKEKGKFKGEDIVRLCVKQPACARFISRKLYRFYVSDAHTPPDTFLEPLAAAFRKSECEIKVLVRMILGSRHFFSQHAYRQKVKSPVDLVVGTVWELTTREVPPTALVPKLDEMGQALFAPPNVKGWPGGTAWLNTSTMLARHNFAQAIAVGNLKPPPSRSRNRFADAEDAAIEAQEQAKLAEEEARKAAEGLKPGGEKNPPVPVKEPPPPPPPANLDVAALIRQEKATTAEAIIAVLCDALLQGDVGATARAKLVAFVKKDDPKGAALERRARDAAHLIMTMPEYQVC